MLKSMVRPMVRSLVSSLVSSAVGGGGDTSPALILDGIDDYLSIPLTNLAATSGLTTMEYEAKLFLDSSMPDTALAGRLGQTKGLVRIRPTEVQVSYGSQGSQSALIPVVIPFDDAVHVIKIQRAGDIHTVLLDDVEVGSINNAITSSNYPNDQLMAGGGVFATTQLHYLIFRDAIDGNVLYNWSAEDSNRTTGAPVLTETVAANNATGVNMPTDGSAWTELS